MGLNESDVADSLRAKGYSAIARGWPDLLVFKRAPDGRLVAIAAELKFGQDRPSNDQIECIEILNRADVLVASVIYASAASEGAKAVASLWSAVAERRAGAAQFMPPVTEAERRSGQSASRAGEECPKPGRVRERFISQLTVRLVDAAKVVGVSPAYLRNEIKRGRLSALRMGRAVVIRTAELNRYVEELEPK